MPDRIAKYEPQALKCKLAFLNGPAKNHPVFEESALYLRDLIWDQELQVRILYKEAEINNVLVCTTENLSIDHSVNYEMVKRGLV